MIDQTQMTKDLVDVVNRKAGVPSQDWCRWSIDIDPPTPRDRLVAD